MSDELVRREVPQEMMDKVLKFAQANERFTTKELFTKFENNPEFLLRYALNNLRIDKAILMYGNKRGSFYSTNFNLSAGESSATEPGSSSSDLKTRILELAKKQSGWFARTDLGIDDVSIPAILTIIKELIEEKQLESQGALRWTKYRIFNAEAIAEEDEEVTSSDIYSDILDFIKKRKVVTIPMIIDELEFSRVDIVNVLSRLEDQEEIYHEGIKKSSKYIYKTVQSDEVETIMAQLSKERKIEERIDDLSSFLVSEEATAMSIGLDENEIMQVKFMRNGSINRLEKFEDLLNGLKFIYGLTEMKHG